ncbi:MAG: FecR domain-containing protein [Kiritimatiellae bacterium]|nr:FecR domain-containing protein [Kiritimatiellia bacterium]
MKTGELHALLEAYRDGELTDRDARRLAGAINAGDADSDRIMAEVRFTGLLSEALQQIDSETFLRSFMERLRAEETADDFVTAFERRARAPVGRRQDPHEPGRMISRGAGRSALRRWYTAGRGWRITGIAAALLVALGALLHHQWRALAPIRGEAPRAVASIARLNGQVYVVRAGGRAAARAGDELKPGEQVMTAGAGSTAYVTLGASSHLELGANGCVSFGPVTPSAPAGHGALPAARLYVQQGTVQVHAGKTADRPTLLGTPHAAIRIAGTRFELAVGPQATRIDLAEGRLLVQNRTTAETITLEAGFQARIGAQTVVAPSARAGPARTGEGLQALYTFREGRGRTVRDVSGIGRPLDLTIPDEQAVQWLPDGGLTVRAPTLIASQAPAAKITETCRGSNAFSVEVWIRPASVTQGGTPTTGPARIVTVSAEHRVDGLIARNFMLGQWADRYDLRVRTTGTDPAGNPGVSSARGAARARLTHLVLTRDAAGVVRGYVDGGPVPERIAVETARETQAPRIGGTLARWDPRLRLALANEFAEPRAWCGEYHLVAIYCRALSPAEIRAHFNAGPAAR